MAFEQGPIRPPSEAASLLIRVARNCPWNKCKFCLTYKDTAFSRRDPEEVRREILGIRELTDRVRALSLRQGCGGEVNEQVVRAAYSELGPYGARVAVWLYHGARTVFLQDANALDVKTADLVAILEQIRNSFPPVERVTTYARANTAARKSLEDLKSIRQAGLSRIHLGMESGSADVLTFMAKGITPEILIKAGQKIVAAGISLCVYVMPGLGGRRWSHEHALETARVINAINPDHIRLRSLAVVPGTPLHDDVQAGSFHTLAEDDLVREIRLLIESLEGISSRVVSDHILNLLEEVEGQLPGDKAAMLAVIDRYLNLPDAERVNFQVGRRMGVYRFLEDMLNPARYSQVSGAVEYLCGQGDVEGGLAKIKERFL